MRLTPQVKQQSGFSLIELMVAITIGLIMMVALGTLFLNITRSNSEMAKTNLQIENGRFAMQILQSDAIHAGFWGRLSDSTAFSAAAAIPNPCLATASWSAAYNQNLLAIPVQGFADGSTLGSCNVSNVLSRSDVLVVSHANTCTAGAGCDGGVADTGPHIQTSSCQAGSPPPEPAYVISTTTFPLKNKDCTTIAPKRKIVSNIYYLANNNSLPTLMRISLVNGAYSQPQPLIEGIEAFKVEYGIDSLGKNGLVVSTSNPGDGSPDTYVSCPSSGCSLNELNNIVAVKLYVLARNLEATAGYKDTKSYQLGATNIPAANDPFKRHVFSTTVRLVNPSSRRELP
ncbi:MAG: PilW family protein [Pseudomonadota bacterium]